MQTVNIFSSSSSFSLLIFVLFLSHNIDLAFNIAKQREREREKKNFFFLLIHTCAIDSLECSCCDLRRENKKEGDFVSSCLYFDRFRLNYFDKFVHDDFFSIFIILFMPLLKLFGLIENFLGFGGNEDECSYRIDRSTRKHSDPTDVDIHQKVSDVFFFPFFKRNTYQEGSHHLFTECMINL